MSSKTVRFLFFLFEKQNVFSAPRQCTSCGNLAEMECKDCYISGLEGSSFCAYCLEKAHSHFSRNNHKMRKLSIPVEFAELQEHCSVPRLNMNLFAVVCIETSHYVTFLNTSQGWVFFDSMADRKGNLSKLLKKCD